MHDGVWSRAPLDEVQRLPFYKSLDVKKGVIGESHAAPLDKVSFDPHMAISSVGECGHPSTHHSLSLLFSA